MPVYNAASYLNEAIRCLVNQTYSNWELIAIDDGSTDESWQILQSYSDGRIKKIKRKNGGQSVATNAGIDHISGNLVLFFDADDLMDPKKIEEQVNMLKDEPNSIAVGKWAFFINSIADAKFKEEPVYYTGTPVEWLYRLWTYETMMPNHSYMIPRKIMEKAGKYYDETILLNIDFEYFTRMVMEADKVIYCEDSICYYRKAVTTSKTFKPSLQKQLSALNARVKAIEKFLQKYQDERSKEAAKMALTILTFSFPAIRKYSKKAIKDFGLKKFGTFGGPRFKMLYSAVGFENAIRLKRIFQKFI
jgi:glycosyltransferase involved in cell wall biosynthesis